MLYGDDEQIYKMNTKNLISVVKNMVTDSIFKLYMANLIGLEFVQMEIMYQNGSLTFAINNL
jgi:hypothetical protein